MTTTILNTPRLRLREATLDDAGFVLRLVNEPGWHRYINDPGVRDLPQAAAWIESRLLTGYREQGFGFWLIERQLDGAPLGIAGLTRRPALAGPDLGYALLAEHEGKGFALEAAQACVARARERFGWPELWALTSAENPRSAHLLRKLGFVDQGLQQLEGFDTPSRIWRLAL